MGKYVILAVNSMLVSNIVFAQFLGICPYLGVSKEFKSALGMSAALIFVMVMAQAVTWPIQHLILHKLDLDHLQTMTFILVIASLVQLVEMILKKYSPALYRALGIYLPLITTNCTILAVTLLSIKKSYSFPESIVFAVATGSGFALALIVFSGIRERLELSSIPKSFRGPSIALITAGILSLAFMGFAGLVK